jgi:hypothetical protein
MKKTFQSLDMSTRGLSFWLVWVAFGFVVLTGIWLAYVGIQISSAGHRFTAQALEAPTYDQFKKALRLEQLAAPKLAGAPTSEQAARDASVAQIFAWIAEFENGRASDRLKKIPPVLSGVVFGGLAERIGIRSGDEVVSVNGAEVKSVLDVYDMLDQRGEQTVRLVIRRQGKLFAANLAAPAGERINAENSGLLFNVPKGLNVVGKSQTASLAAQFDTRFMLLVPPEWRRQYQQNLAVIAHELLSYIDSQRDRVEGDPGFIRIDQVLSWHHDAFMAAIEQHVENTRSASASQLAALGSFGDAIIGLIAALALFFIAFWFHNREKLMGEE